MGVKLIDHRGVPSSQLHRTSPCTKGISKKKRSSIDALAKRYIKFLKKARINSEVTYELLKLAEQKGFFEDENHLKFENEEQTAFALVRPGRKPIEEGLRIIYSHTDAPCLQIKAAPVRMEWDPDLQPFHLGVGLSVMPYGGAVHYNWRARDVEVRGWTVKNGRKRKIKFPGYIPDLSDHVNDRGNKDVDEAFLWEQTRVCTGHGGEEELLKFLKFNSREDFGRSKLYVVPTTKAGMLSAGNYIYSYGHDDRCCGYTSTEAFVAVNNPLYTTMLIGFDKEEIGGDGEGGAKGKFFERILEDIIVHYAKIDLKEVTQGMISEILRNSYALSADVDVGSSFMEEKKSEGVDIRSMAKLGYGVIISAFDGGLGAIQNPAHYLDKIISMVDKKKVRRQITGTPHDADNFEGAGAHAQFFSDRGIPTLECGIGVSGLHSHCELIHAGDLYWMKQAYKTFFGDNKK